MTLFTDLRIRAAKHAAYRKTLRELSALSKAEADDLGINTSELRGIARRAVYG